MRGFQELSCCSESSVIEHRPVTIFRWFAARIGSTIFRIGIRLSGEGILVITSYLSNPLKAAVPVIHFRSPLRLFALLPALISLVIPAAAWGDIYKWTDEQGRTVLSNVPPSKTTKARGIELLAKEAGAAAKAPGSIPEHVATPTEQALLARIESLERQLQARRYAGQAPAVSPPTTYSDYYPPSPPPPPPGYYGSGYDSTYTPGYYPSYYGPVLPVYSYVVFPARTFVSRPVFAVPQGRSFHRGGGHRGRR